MASSEGGMSPPRGQLRVVLLLLCSTIVISSQLPQTYAGPLTRAFPHSTWSTTNVTWIESSGNVSCGSAIAGLNGWSPWSGVARMTGTSLSKVCPWTGSPYGTPIIWGDGEVNQFLLIQAPVKMPSGKGGVNISWTWNISENWTVRVSGPRNPVSCPVLSSNTSTKLSNTWKNVTYENSDCGGYAEVEVTGNVSLVDLSTNTTYRGSPRGWIGVGGEAAWQNLTIKTLTNYSSPASWTKNSSAAIYDNYSSPSGSFRGSFGARWWVNGTFSATDHYLLYIGLTAEQSSYFYSSSPGVARTSLNMGRHGFGATLMPIVIW